MHYYQLYGRILRCEKKIPQLKELEEVEKWEMELLLKAVPEEIRKMQRKQQEKICGWTESYGWFQNSYAMFAVYKDGTIYVEQERDGNLDLLMQFVLGYGVAIYIHLNGGLALHCGAITWKGQAFGLLGRSGAGKSTLAAAMIKKGAKLLGDDVLAVKVDETKQIMAYPALPQQKLCRDQVMREKYEVDTLQYIDAEKDKFLIPCEDTFQKQKVPLTKIFILQWEEAGIHTEKVQIESVTGVGKLQEILENLFLIQMFERVGISPEMMQCCVDVANNCEVYKIKRPKRDWTLEKTVELLQQYGEEKG